MRPQRLGTRSVLDQELAEDKKNCRKFGPCGVGKRAIYLNSFYIDRRYYIPMRSVTRIFKRIAMSKGGFTGKGAFGTIPYLVVEYEGGGVKQCNFKHEEDVDRLLAYVGTHFPDIPLHSREAEKKLAEKEKRLREKYQGVVLTEKAKSSLHMLENAEKYLRKDAVLYTDLSQSAKRKRTYDRSNPAYKWVALVITIMGVLVLLYGIYALTAHAGFGMYFLLFGLAAIFLFSGASVLPTSRNNRRLIEKQLSESVERMERYVAQYPDFPVPAHYAHPIVLKRMEDIIKEGRTETIPEALKLLKEDLRALNSGVVVEKEEYDEVVAIKPMFLVMNYR